MWFTNNRRPIETVDRTDVSDQTSKFNLIIFKLYFNCLTYFLIYLSFTQAAQEQRLIYSGFLLRDGDSLETVFQCESSDTSETELYTVHLVCSLKQSVASNESTVSESVSASSISSSSTLGTNATIHTPQETTAASETAFSMQFTSNMPFTSFNGTQLPPEQLTQLYSQMTQAYNQYMTTYMQAWQTLAGNQLLHNNGPAYPLPLINLMGDLNASNMANMAVQQPQVNGIPAQVPIPEPLAEQPPPVPEAINNAHAAAAPPIDLFQRIETYAKILSVLVLMMFTVPLFRAVLIILVVLTMKLYGRYRRTRPVRPAELVNPVQEADPQPPIMERPVEPALPVNLNADAPPIAAQPDDAPAVLPASNTTQGNNPEQQNVAETSRLRFLWHVVTSLFTSLVPNNHEVHFL